MTNFRNSLLVSLGILTPTGISYAQDGATLYRTYCAICHEGAQADAQAPNREVMNKDERGADPSIVAFDLNTGQIRWFHQVTENDIWNGSCGRPNREAAVCPDKDAPDFSGPAIVGGMLFVNCGYSHHGGILPGNVLLAFSLE